MRPQTDNETEQRYLDRAQSRRQYSYDQTQRLTFFVISVELIFCGYILLNADKLGKIDGSSILFLVAGSAALFGCLWRFLYNQAFHENTHGHKNKGLHKFLGVLQRIVYYVYIALSVVFFIAVLSLGYSHLRGIENKIQQAASETASTPMQKANPDKKTEAPDAMPNKQTGKTETPAKTLEAVSSQENAPGQSLKSTSPQKGAP